MDNNFTKFREVLCKYKFDQHSKDLDKNCMIMPIKADDDTIYLEVANKRTYDCRIQVFIRKNKKDILMCFQDLRAHSVYSLVDMDFNINSFSMDQFIENIQCIYIFDNPPFTYYKDEDSTFDFTEIKDPLLKERLFCVILESCYVVRKLDI